MKKFDSHKGLLLLFARYGVPSMLTMNGSKEQTMGQFRKKAKETLYFVQQTKPYPSWKNAAEMLIRDLKKRVKRKIIKSGALQQLWDY